MAIFRPKPSQIFFFGLVPKSPVHIALIYVKNPKPNISCLGPFKLTTWKNDFWSAGLNSPVKRRRIGHLEATSLDYPLIKYGGGFWLRVRILCLHLDLLGLLDLGPWSLDLGLWTSDPAVVFESGLLSPGPNKPYRWRWTFLRRNHVHTAELGGGTAVHGYQCCQLLTKLSGQFGRKIRRLRKNLAPCNFHIFKGI